MGFVIFGVIGVAESVVIGLVIAFITKSEAIFPQEPGRALLWIRKNGAIQLAVTFGIIAAGTLLIEFLGLSTERQPIRSGLILGFAIWVNNQILLGNMSLRERENAGYLKEVR
jgi:hypothetical protein